MGFVHHSPRPGGSGLYHYALILYHLTTARGLGSGARSVSENANVNSRSFGSSPAEICGDLREHCCGSQRLETPHRCTPVREGWGGRCRVAAGRATVAGGRPGPAHGDRHAGWLWRSVVLVEAGMARRCNTDLASDRCTTGQPERPRSGVGVVRGRGGPRLRSLGRPTARQTKDGSGERKARRRACR